MTSNPEVIPKRLQSLVSVACLHGEGRAGKLPEIPFHGKYIPSQTPDPVTSTTSEDPHYIVLLPAHDRSAVFVSLYGFNFRVELGPKGVLPEPVVVFCEIDGSGMRVGSVAEISNLTARMETAVYSQPWLLPRTG
jgi:hypothetical protein